ncbi:MAG TPA: M48 family metallopeptidase [Chitinophagaceae bacterium]|nr:M48 family metallopeptidase [Chitinophagaceae bacterium]
MKKILLSLFILIALFLGLWFVLSRVDWMKLLRIEKITKSTEEKLGDMFWEIYKDKEINDSTLTRPVDSILIRICKANGFDRSTVKLHVVEMDEVNAFAMPNGHMVINRGLLADVKDEAELAGVMSHELAHVQEKHVMKKLVKEVGLSVLITVATGGGGGDVAAIARLLSSSAYDRKLEKEADMKAVDYMVTARISPDHLADFLYRLGQNDPDDLRYLNWISTHPDSKERAEYIVTYAKGKLRKPEPILASTTWEQMKSAIVPNGE